MLDVDNPAPARPSGHGRPRGSSPLSRLGSGGGPDRRVLLGGIAGAVVLGLLIGLLTASSGGGGSKTPTLPRPSAAETVAPSFLTPAAPKVQRQGAGSAQNVTLDRPNRDALRYAFYQAYADGRLGRLRSGLTVSQVMIPPRTIHYGVVEGTSAVQDVYWAVAPVYFSGVAGQNTVVRRTWRRAGRGPWQYEGSGCAQASAAFRAATQVSGC